MDFINLLEKIGISPKIVVLLSIILVICIVLFFLFLAIRFTMKMGAKYQNHKNDHDNHKKTDEGLSKISETLIKVETTLNHISKDIESLKHANSINIKSSGSRPIAQTSSPLKLTDDGKSLAIDIKAENLYNQHKEYLKTKVLEQNPSDAYGIQQYSFRVIEDIFIEHLEKNDIIGLQNLRKVAFEKGYTVEDLLIIFGIYLRDELLKEKCLLVEDVNANK